MEKTYPEKLKAGDEVRVVAPSKSMRSIFTDDMKAQAIKQLENLGLKVSFGKYIEEENEFQSTTIEHRLEDLHDAFADKDIKGILTVTGGTSSNQLLKYLDYDLIKNNPKVLSGISDITSLKNAIFTKTGLVTYSGPYFTSFGTESHVDYTTKYFKKCCFSEEPIEIKPSEYFYNKRGDSEKNKNEGPWSINEGEASGTIIGANLITFNLLQGTEFYPDLTDSIVFVEDNHKENIRAFESHLQSLILQPNFEKVKGIAIGRFQMESGMTKELLTKIVKSKRELNNIPVIANLDFGHTKPFFTFPIGGECRINANKLLIEVTKH